MTIAPDRDWWTPEALAQCRLPGLPATRQGIDAIVKREGWRETAGKARKREASGGGWEYHWTLLPPASQARLIAASAVAVRATPAVDRTAQWRWYDSLPATVKAKAEQRLRIIEAVRALEGELGRNAAAAAVATAEGVSTRSIWSWIALAGAVPAADRLPALAPRNRSAEREKPAQRDCAPEFMDWLKADYLREESPAFSACYRRAVRVAAAKGWAVLTERTARRRLEETVSQPVQVLARKGREALRRMYPPQVRDKTAMGALEAVNADFHKFDVFVRWPGASESEIVRPQMVAFQDIYSGRILSWRIDVTPNSTAVLLAAGDMIDAWGIPEHVLLDNGREFAAKALTGGAPTRYRFKVREDDLPGLFTTLGCQIHWATPYSGQSKPIERAFRDLCETVSKDPRLAGAWAGNRPGVRPDDYKEVPVELDTFLAVVAEGIEEHNTRTGRRSEVAYGRSFAEVFDESYESRAIIKATDAQRRMWLLGAEGVRADRRGLIKFLGNEFWDGWCHVLAGERVIIRFDPAELQAGVHVYRHDGSYAGFASCRVKAGFFSLDDARTQARARSQWMAAEKKALAAHRRLKRHELGAELDRLAPAELPTAEAKVVRPMFGRTVPRFNDDATEVNRPLETAPSSAPDVTYLLKRAKPETVAEETLTQRFARALELEGRLTRGEALTEDQANWLRGYQTHHEYRAQMRLRTYFAQQE